MKKIIKPAEKAVCVYFSDFSGKLFGEFDPEVKIKIEFNYGSIYDGTEIEFHATDEEISSILEHIKEKRSEDYKKSIQQRLDSTERNFEKSMQMRDWGSCDYESNSLHFLRYMLDIKES